MRGENYLAILSASFIAGNLLTAALFRTALQDRPEALLPYALTGIFSAAVLLLSGRCSRRSSPVLFLILGGYGYALLYFFQDRKQERILSDGNLFRICGTAEHFGRSSSGRRFVELDTGNEHTVIWNIPPEELLPAETGDLIYADVIAHEIRNFSEDFDYRKYMAGKGIFCSCTLTRQRRISSVPVPRPAPQHFFSRIRDRYQKTVFSLLHGKCSEEVIGLVTALSCGDRSGLDRSTEENFRKSGSSHLLALSGMHLGILYSCISGILSIAGNYLMISKIRSFILLILLWSYSLFTGLGLSVFRSVMMITFYEAGKMAGLEKSGLNTLAASALLITLLNPEAPSDISFQLSCGAMSGIFIIYPHLKPLIGEHPKIVRWVWNLATLSLSCQMITLPLVLLHFRTVALFSLLSNLICSPLTSFIMILIPFTLFTGFVFSGISLPFCTLLQVCTETLLEINRMIADL